MYNKMANDFLANTGTTIEFEYVDMVRDPWNNGSTWMHDVYNVTISRNGKEFTVNFKQSAHATANGIEPTAYDVLACLEKYGYDSYREFCYELGYEGSEESLSTYYAVMEEYNNVLELFGDCMEWLQEIC